MFRTVTLKDLIKYYERSMTTAKTRLKAIRKAYNKHRITIYDLAIYEGYSPSCGERLSKMYVKHI